MAVIGIHSNEDKSNLIYEDVYLSPMFLNDTKIFNSGDFVKDWFNAMKYYLNNYSEKEYLSYSSSVDHFIFDGAEFDSAYLDVDGEIPKLIFEYEEGKIEVFVKRGERPTWEELKEYCKS